MSTIVSPWPPRIDETPPPEGQVWWRLRLYPNEDGYTTLMRFGPPGFDDNWSWMTIEFFDGCDAIIDAGLDRPTRTHIKTLWGDDRTFLYVLGTTAPTPCSRWEVATQYRWPDGMDPEVEQGRRPLLDSSMEVL